MVSPHHVVSAPCSVTTSPHHADGPVGSKWLTPHFLSFFCVFLQDRGQYASIELRKVALAGQIGTASEIYENRRGSLDIIRMAVLGLS